MINYLWVSHKTSSLACSGFRYKFRYLSGNLFGKWSHCRLLVGNRGSRLGTTTFIGFGWFTLANWSCIGWNWLARVDGRIENALLVAGTGGRRATKGSLGWTKTCKSWVNCTFKFLVLGDEIENVPLIPTGLVSPPVTSSSPMLLFS